MLIIECVGINLQYNMERLYEQIKTVKMKTKPANKDKVTETNNSIGINRTVGTSELYLGAIVNSDENVNYDMKERI